MINTKSTNDIIDFITLKFIDKNLNRSYYDYYFDESIKTMRIASAFAVILYILFGLTDVVNYEDNLSNSKVKIVQNKIAVDEIISDKNQLSTIIRNLISNAIKFSKDGGTIEIGSSITEHIDLVENNKTLNIYIKDNGVGIDAERIDKLF